jgi:uncharacterized cupin superfamily protein
MAVRRHVIVERLPAPAVIAPERKETMNRPILNIADVRFEPRPAQYAPKGPAADRYGAKTAAIGQQLGAQRLGYNITAIEPGKRAFPLHNHRENEEMFFMLSGTGEILIGEDRFAVKPGDIIACPPGGPETAHQIINTGNEDLRFLAVSTRISPEICDYPRTGSFGVLAQYPDVNGGTVYMFKGKPQNSEDYWQDE